MDDGSRRRQWLWWVGSRPSGTVVTSHSVCACTSDEACNSILDRLKTLNRAVGNARQQRVAVVEAWREDTSAWTILSSLLLLTALDNRADLVQIVVSTHSTDLSWHGPLTVKHHARSRAVFTVVIDDLRSGVSGLATLSTWLQSCLVPVWRYLNAGVYVSSVQSYLSVCLSVRPSGTEDIVRVYAEADTQVRFFKLFTEDTYRVCQKRENPFLFGSYFV